MKNGKVRFQLVDVADAKDVDAAEVDVTTEFVMDALDQMEPENGHQGGALAEVGDYEVLQPDAVAAAAP